MLWDDELRPRSDARLLINEGRIERLLEPEEPVPSGVPVHGYENATILPGLIDTHCHLTLPGDGRDVDRFLSTASDEELVQVGLRNAHAALLGGVTTLRDLGARGDTAFDLVRLLDEERGPAPRVVVSGPAITRPRGHGWSFGLEVCGAPAMREAVRRLHANGAGVIKVMASGGSTPGTETWRASFTVEELRAAVETAHACGLPVAAHISCPEAAVRCLDAGVDDLEHLNLWSDSVFTNTVDPDLLARIARRSAVVGPTLQTPYRILHENAEVDDPRSAVRAKLCKDVLSNCSQFVEFGLRLIAGSDAGFLVTRFDELHLGLRLLVERGLTPRQALRAATVEAAAALQLQNETGCLRPGLDADILIVEGDPLADIAALQNVRAVFVRGRRVESTVRRTESV